VGINAQQDETFPPIRSIASPSNHRDLVGLMTSAGPLRPGRLLRGALHDGNVPPVGLSGDGQIHLLDLRRQGEGSGLPPSWVCPHSWPLHDPEWTHGGARSPAFFVESALRLVPYAAGPVGDALDLLGRGESVYVGCRLGKDRTGLMVLLLGRLFNVPDAALVQDYAHTGAEYAGNTDWVRRYARDRGEDADKVAGRLAVIEDIPAGILAGLPERTTLLALLKLTETQIAAAMETATRP
jgi:Tyrosine phosphatase family